MNNRLEELLNQYWNAAYSEGKERRSHDTEDSIAQNTLSEIRGLLDSIYTSELILMSEKHHLQLQLTAERAVSDRLLDALKRVIGSHNAPDDCYATGPLTGNSYRDLVECPSCAGEALIAEVEAIRKEKQE